MPDSSTLLFFAMLAVVVFGSLAAFLHAHEEDRRDATIAEHIVELSAARRALLPAQRLGLVDRKKWERTQRSFLYGHFELSGRKEHAPTVARLMARMDALIDDHDAVSAAEDLPVDAHDHAPPAGSTGQGVVYLLSNPSMPGLLKIGMTARDIDSRLRELNAPTGVPTPFSLVFHVLVSDCAAAERCVHAALAAYRTRQGREFFQLDSTVAIEAMLQARSRFPRSPAGAAG